MWLARLMGCGPRKRNQRTAGVAAAPTAAATAPATPAATSPDATTAVPSLRGSSVSFSFAPESVQLQEPCSPAALPAAGDDRAATPALAAASTAPCATPGLSFRRQATPLGSSNAGAHTPPLWGGGGRQAQCTLAPLAPQCTPGSQTPELRFVFDPCSAASPHITGLPNSGSKYAVDQAVKYRAVVTPIEQKIDRALAAERVGAGWGGAAAADGRGGGAARPGGTPLQPVDCALSPSACRPSMPAACSAAAQGSASVRRLGRRPQLGRSGSQAGAQGIKVPGRAKL